MFKMLFVFILVNLIIFCLGYFVFKSSLTQRLLILKVLAIISITSTISAILLVFIVFLF